MIENWAWNNFFKGIKNLFGFSNFFLRRLGIFLWYRGLYIEQVWVGHGSKHDSQNSLFPEAPDQESSLSLKNHEHNMDRDVSPQLVQKYLMNCQRRYKNLITSILSSVPRRIMSETISSWIPALTANSFQNTCNFT